MALVCVDPQMVPVRELVRPWNLPAITGIVSLSTFHARECPAFVHAANRSVVIPYGLDASGFVDGPNPHQRFIYASSPVRGLEQVLHAWPRVYHALGGNATLSVFYGFTPAFVRSLSEDPSVGDAQAWLDRMSALLRQPGVVYVGLVDHARLAKEYAHAGFVLYPTSYPETGCFALMKVRGYPL